MSFKELKKKSEAEPAIIWFNNGIPKLIEVGEGLDTHLEIETKRHKPEIVLEKFLTETWENLEEEKGRRKFLETIVETLPVQKEKKRSQGIHRSKILAVIERNFWENEEFTVKDLLYKLPGEIHQALSGWNERKKKSHLRLRLNILQKNGWLTKSKKEGKNHYAKTSKFEKYLKNHNFEDLEKP